MRRRPSRSVLLVSMGLTLILAAASSAAGATSDAALVRRILQDTGIQGGLVVHLGCGDGKLTAALRATESYLVQGLDTDPTKVDQARAYVHSLGCYGQVTIDRLRGPRLPYVDNLVRLLVVSDLGNVPMEEVKRVLCPRGVAYINRAGSWTKTAKPWPDNIDEWTHYLHDASNNAVSHDTVAGPPRHYQWVAGPKWARTHDHLATISAVVSANGRIFYIVDESPAAFAAIPPKWSLVARDAFSGVLLWKRSVSPWEGHLRGFRSGPAGLPRRLVAAGDRVYVTLGYDKPVVALDAATGKTTATYGATSNALEIVYHRGVLYVVAGDRAPDGVAGPPPADKRLRNWQWWAVYGETPPRKRIVAVDARSGSLLWQKADADTADLMPTTLAAAGAAAFFQSPQAVLALDAASGSVRWRAARPTNRRRPSWSAPTLVVYGDVVLSADRSASVPPQGAQKGADGSALWLVNSSGGHAPPGLIMAFATDTGRKIWEAKCRECYNSPVDVLVANGKVWSGDLVRRTDPGITRALDVRTGAQVFERPRDQESLKIGMGHHRCYRNKATTQYLLLGRDGIEFIDTATGEALGHPWVRGGCQYGVMPCNGLVYAPSHSCACHIESKLDSFNALAGHRPEVRGQKSDRLEKGPAYGIVGNAQSGIENPEDWPTYRHDAARSGRSSCTVPARMQTTWTAKLPGKRLSCPVAAAGAVLVACIDTHTVCALGGDDGRPLWRFHAGGRVDSPPTIHNGAAIFGCADGWVYCLRLGDGALAWRSRSAPADRRMVAYGQVESPWPLHGSVLVRDGVVYAVAGRSAHLDGGLRLCRLEAATGKMLSETPITSAALPDVLSCDGANVFMRHKRFNLQGVEQAKAVVHLFSSAGFLDDAWWHRTYWQVGTRMWSGWGAWPRAGTRVPAGRLLVVDGDRVYGYGRLNQYHRSGTHAGLGKVQYFLYASTRTPKVVPANPAEAARAARQAKAVKAGKAKKRWRRPIATKIVTLWSERIPLLVRAMTLSDKTLFAAGPPDVMAVAPEGVKDIYYVASQEALREQDAALAGARRGILYAVDTATGKAVAQQALPAPPVFDGLIAAKGRLYAALMDGTVTCLSGR